MDLYEPTYEEYCEYIQSQLVDTMAEIYGVHELTGFDERFCKSMASMIVDLDEAFRRIYGSIVPTTTVPENVDPYVWTPTRKFYGTDENGNDIYESDDAFRKRMLAGAPLPSVEALKERRWLPPEEPKPMTKDKLSKDELWATIKAAGGGS